MDLWRHMTDPGSRVIISGRIGPLREDPGSGAEREQKSTRQEESRVLYIRWNKA